MLYLCKLIIDRSGMEGIRILECRGLDSLVVIPEDIKGTPVTELAPYIFSAQEDLWHSQAWHSWKVASLHYWQ